MTVNKQAYRIIYWQLILILGLAVILFLLEGIESGFSTLLGGLAYWLPTLFFVWRVFARVRSRTAKQFLISFIGGEALKLVFSGILFVLILKYLPVHILSVLAGFICAVIAFWIASMYFLANQEVRS